MPFGRPTLYKPEYCDQLIEHMADGRSFESFGAKIDVSRATLYNWRETNKEFLDAFNVGQLKHFAWMEEKARAHLVEHFQGPKLNVGLFKLFMANIHGWRDSKSEDQNSKPKKTITLKYDRNKKIKTDES
jgi:hypothetical protein